LEEEEEERLFSKAFVLNQSYYFVVFLVYRVDLLEEIEQTTQN
jgi:hypothetical protein